jgi:hypothetical protein
MLITNLKCGELYYNIMTGRIEYIYSKEHFLLRGKQYARVRFNRNGPRFVYCDYELEYIGTDIGIVE